MNTLTFHPAMPADYRAMEPRSGGARRGMLRALQILFALVLLLGARCAFAQTALCSSIVQTNGTANGQILPPANTTLFPTPAFTIIGGWHRLDFQPGKNCRAGTYPANITPPSWNTFFDQSFEKNIDGTNYTVFKNNGYAMGLIIKVSNNGNAFTPVAGISTNGSTQSLPNITLTAGGDWIQSIEYAWVTTTAISSGMSGQAFPGPSFPFMNSVTTDGLFYSNKYAWFAARAWNYNTVNLTCNFQGTGTDGGTDTLPAVSLGSFVTSTFSNSSAGWKDVGIKTSSACNAYEVYMTFKNGPGYASPAGDTTLFGAKMGGNLDPSLGVQLRRWDNNIVIKANDTVGIWPPSANTEYVQARLAKVGSGTPLAGTSGTSLITVTTTYQ